MSLLEVSGLTVGIERSPEALLRDVDFTVEAGEVMGLVGESGSGKTMASLAIMGLLPVGIEQREGTIRLGGRNLVDVSTGTVKRTASEMTMIFQDPRSALNPTMRVGHQIGQ